MNSFRRDVTINIYGRMTGIYVKHTNKWLLTHSQLVPQMFTIRNILDRNLRKY